MKPGLEAYRSAGGHSIYRIPLEVFPGFWGYAHLVLAGSYRCLMDVGSGLDASNQGLEEGLEAIRRSHGEEVDWRSLTHVVISHGHIDHFGGLRYVRQKTDAPIGVHELDFRVLTRYEERLTEATDALSEFLTDAGLEPQHSAAILDMYAVHKSLFASVPVDFVFGSARSSLGPLTVIHTPGHCPGQVVIQVDDILLSGDMVLSDISPHQSPERLTAYTGLGHYLESLTTVERLAPTIRIALGGHQRPIDQLRQRLSAIRDTHQSRLHDVLSAMVRPATMAQVSEMLFPEAVGYNQLLALEEVGAHVEYLHARGYLSLDNADGAGARHSGGHRYRVDPGRPEPRLASADEICPLVNIVASKHRQR